MFWKALLLAVVASGATLAFIIWRRPIRTDDLGAVSAHWIDEHQSQ